MYEDVDAYPLAWPSAWPRSPRPRSSAFGVSFAKARNSLLHELKLLGAKEVILSTNMALRRDGLPYANLPEPDDHGAAVYFVLKGESRCMACDRWNKAKDNIRAVGRTVEALRGISRWGVGTVEQAFTGYQALPPHTGMEVQGLDWRGILGIDSQATLEDAKREYRRKAHELHPDKGGDDYSAMVQLNVAMDEARKRLT